jgi:enamine deaminase RidA (YjgF/YER057c/UK114 family)
MSIRKSIEVEGFHHGGQPIPVASRVGGLVMSGGIYGLDPETDKLPDDVGEQTRLMFWQMGRVLEAAGAGLGDVARMTFYVKDPAARDHVNRHWIEAFPDPASRPSRHTLKYEGLPANMLVQCDFVAMVAE